MRHTLAVTGSVTPQAPGRTPQRSALRLPGGETLPVPGASPRTPVPPEASEAPAREAMMLSGALPAAGRARVSQAARESSGGAGAGAGHARR